MSHAEQNHPKVRSPFLVGITGDFGPVGYVAEPGHLEREGEQVLRIRATFDAILQWIFAQQQHGFLDANSCTFQHGCVSPRNELDSHGRLIAYHDCWKPLAVQASPVVVLSTLAPGISTLFVEAALDFRDKHPELPVFVRGVLPFPSSPHSKHEVYARASIFRTDADRRRYGALLKRMRAQPGWVEQRDLFEVKLDNDWDHNTAEEDLIAKLPAVPSANLPERRRCDLRYRAAGEYIAAFSDLLVAAYDYRGFKGDETPRLEDPFNCGPHAIVEAKRRGLSWELLAITNNFTWADNGPVLRLGIESLPDNCDSPVTSSSPFKLQFLHPHDARPILETDDGTEPPGKPLTEDEKKRMEAAWQANGDSIFRRILKLQDEFNEVPTCDRERLEIYAMILSKDEMKGKSVDELDAMIHTQLGAPALDMVRQLMEAAQYRRRAADYSSQLEKNRGWVMFALVMLIGIGAVCLGTFEHWHPKFHESANKEHTGKSHSGESPNSESHVNEESHAPASENASSSNKNVEGKNEAAKEEDKPSKIPAPSATTADMTVLALEELELAENKIKISLLVLTLGFILGAGCWYFFYNRQRTESKRFDSRALGEALRVQIYWCLSGLNSSVAANYMQRQRDELDWIRYVSSGLTFPFFRWKRSFQSLNIEQRIKLLDRVRIGWVKQQAKYFEKNSMLFGHKAHFWHVVAWSFAITGIFQILLMLLSQLNSETCAFIQHQLFWPSIALLTLSAWPTLNFLIHAFDCWEEKKLFPESWSNWVAAYCKHHSHDDSGHAPIPEHESLWKWILDRREIVFLWMTFTGLFSLCVQWLSTWGIWAPGYKDWWIIMTSSTLVFGGLSLAWVERNFYSEIHRNYSSMRMLYHSAEYRLKQILKRCDELDDANTQGKGQPKQQERLLQEAQDILYNLGCEALNENAEWLILHRSRPLEPFMAG